MVAGAIDHRADPFGIVDHSGRQFGACALYLYSFLIFTMDRSKQWETVVVILTALIVLFWIKHGNGWLIAAAATGIVCLLAPAVAGGLHWGWTRLSLLLGAVSGKILLTIVYVFILVPLAFFARRAGKLTMRMKPGGDSYFKSRNHTYSKEDLIHPW